MDFLNNEPQIDNEKNKKIMKLILIVVAILALVSIGLIGMIMYMQSTALKISVDGVAKNFPEGYFVIENNEVYVPIKDFAKLVGYEVYNGEYKKNTEDTNKCYIESINEIAMFSLGSNKIYKTKPGETNYENFTIEQPVKNINGKLYISSEGIKIACNVKFDYVAQNNSIIIYTLPTLVTNYTQGITKFGYANISENFSAQKAILKDLVVVQKESGKIGVINLEGEDIIGAKYSEITFMESTKEFLVKNDENKVGILSTKGDVKIPLENDKLELLDNDLRLYVATSNGKKGVVDENGKIVIYKEYEEIGIEPTLFPSNNIENQYLLFDNAIPVKKDGKYGLYDKTGKEILPVIYTGFGYVASTTKDKSVNNLLLIPEYEGIVLSTEYGEEDKVKKYGVVNSLGEEIVPFGLEEIYSITSQGKDEYYVVYQGNTLSLSQIKINKPESSKQEDEKADEDKENNTNSNTTNENTTTENENNTMTENNNNTNEVDKNKNQEANQNNENPEEANQNEGNTEETNQNESHGENSNE